MEYVFVVLLFIIGLFLLMKCGDLLVNVCLKFSKITGISEIIIGATMVSIATALPELFVSVIASYQGSNGLAVGNSVGTVICNGALILGLLLSFSVTNYKNKKRDWKIIFPAIYALILFLFCLDFKLNLIENIILVVLFIVFFVYNFIQAKNEVKKFNDHFEKESTHLEEIKTENINQTSEETQKKVKQISRKKQIWLLLLYFVLGAGGVVLGAELLVRSTTKIATFIGISEEIIGFTIVAIGTSLPELVTTINSLIKKKYNLALGNITGANIINLSLILGLSGIFGGGNLYVSNITLWIYIPLVILISIIIGVPILLNNRTKKFQGFALLGLYLAYFISLVVMAFI